MVDQVSVFLHVLAATGMVAGGVVMVMSGARMRAAATTPGIAQWASFARAGGWLTLASAAVSLGTGGHLAGAVWTTDETSGFAYPFITLGAVALLLLAPIGPMLGGAKLRRIIEKTRHSDTAGDLAGLQRSSRSAALWGPVHSLVGVCIGLVWVMTSKPDDWLLTGAILVATFALGWLSGVVLSGGAPPAPTGADRRA
jgi:hypothetical protein